MAEEVAQPKVSVHGIPKDQYDSSGGAESTNQTGLKGHLQKYGMFYLIGIGVITIIVIIMFQQNNAGNAATTDSYGYGTGNSSASDTYGAQLDSDYQMLQNQNSQTNALLAALLAGKTKTSSGGGHKKKGSGDGKVTHPGKGKKITKTKPGGNTSGSSKGHHGITGGGHKMSTKGHSVATHSSGKTTVSKSSSHKSTGAQPNPHAGGAHGWVYTTKPGDTVVSLTEKFWPGWNTGNKKGQQGSLLGYANNRQVLKGKYNSFSGAIKPGTRVVA